jgi:hypothetical protein
LCLGTPSSGLVGLPLYVIMKNKLHMSADAVSFFRLISSIPLYLSFLFGFVRDSWNPFALADRGYLILFGALCSLSYLILASVPASYATLLIGLVLLKIMFLLVESAQSGLASTIGQQRLMSGQISALWNSALSLGGIVALYFAGDFTAFVLRLSTPEAFRKVFLTGAGVMTLLAIFGTMKPSSVFGGLNTHQTPISAHPFSGLAVLLQHRLIYPAFLIWLLWHFQPGSDTAFLYYLQNTLHVDNAFWGHWNALNVASFVPSFAIFGLLSRKYSLKVLLIWATVIAIPQWLPLLYVHTANEALIVAIPIGLLGGGATAAYLSLIIRSSPKALQGTTLMMATGLNAISARFGDVLGTHLYQHFGQFSACVYLMTGVYMLIIPLLLKVPKHLIDTADGTAHAIPK